MPDAVTSPGQAVSERAAVEYDLWAPFEDDLERFLAEVDLTLRREEAEDGGGALTLLLVLALVMGPWERTVVAPHRSRLARLLGRDAGDPAITRLSSAVSDAALPGRVYAALQDVQRLAAAEGWGPQQMMAARREVLDFDRWRAGGRSLVRTQATGVYATRSLELMALSGYTHKRWVAVMDSATREAHAIANGQMVPLEAAFMVGGYAMQYPGDPSAPPSMTANCRCVLIGVA